MDLNETIINDSEPMFAIGLTPDTTITISKRWFDILFIIGIIFVCSLVLLIFILTLYFSAQQEPIITTRPQKVKKPNHKPPYHPYNEMGSLNDERIQINIVDQFYANKDNCKQACDRNVKCHAFIQSDNWCTLLSDTITIPSSDTIYERSEPSFYSKNPDNIIFDGRILLATNGFAVPSKYWLNTKPDQSLFFPRNKIIKLNFYPNYIKLNQPDTGIYCSFPFELSDIPNLIQTNLCYIHAPNDDLQVFPDFKGKPIYVAYTSFQK
jgi:hypothetical protein